MNGYKDTANSYRELVRREELEENDYKKTIEIYDFLATCSQEDFCTILDSSAFNEIIKCYMKKALHCAKVDFETYKKIISEMNWLFDEFTAKQILNDDDED